MPQIVRGTSTLISSPTASGKTEAVFAPLYQRHISFRRANLSVVYVAPTKALVNDLYERLLAYFGAFSPEIVQRYTGDHHDFGDPAGKFVLLATPEALDSLQLVRPEKLAHVRAVVCDELHLLHGTPRGQQLRSVIARIRAYAYEPKDPRDTFQVVGMSATMADHESVAQLWLGENAECISAGDPREIDLSIIKSDRHLLADRLVERLGNDTGKVLVFCNSRNGAHVLAAALSERLASARWSVYMHIGIISKEEREHIERSMKAGSRSICVATSTLEVGIDIGDIDIVVLADVPKSVGAFLQRIGRGNRRSGKCVVWACCQDEHDEQVMRALLYCGERGLMDERHEYQRPSVEFQQAMSLAWIGVRRHRALTLANVGERSGGAVTQAVIEDMMMTGALRDVRGALVPSDSWMDEGDRRRIHTCIVGASGLPIVDTRSGHIFALAAGAREMRGAVFAGSRLREIQSGDDSGVYVSSHQGNGALAKLPSAQGKKGGLSRPLVWAMSLMRGADPHVWQYDGMTVATYGGFQYNKLLAILLDIAGIAKTPQYNPFLISGIPNAKIVTPVYGLRLIEEWSERIPASKTEWFVERTPYFHDLSAEQQRTETLRAVPWRGLRDWLSVCVGAREAALRPAED